MVARWKANPKERLAYAALDLFAERGYDSTTVADIVERAELTRSTFFRHFEDKREVLFGGQDALLGILLQAVAEAPPGATAQQYLELLVGALAGRFEPAALTVAATRATVIRAHPELRERDLLKRAQLDVALTAALNARGIDGATARLAATITLWSFDTALDRWSGGAHGQPFERLLTEAAHDLLERAAVLSGSAPAAEPPAGTRGGRSAKR